jgi:hypothetical protein
MDQLSQFDIDEIISYCDLKTKSRLNIIMKNIVLSTTIMDEQKTMIHYVFEHNGLTILIERHLCYARRSRAQQAKLCFACSVESADQQVETNKNIFRLDRTHGFDRMIESIYYIKCSFTYDVKTLYGYLSTILSILSKNPKESVLELRVDMDKYDEYIGLRFYHGKTMYGGNVLRYVGARLVE